MDAILFWIVAVGKRLLGNIASSVHLGIGWESSLPCGSTFLELFCWKLADLSALNYHRFDFFVLLVTTTRSLWPLELLNTTIFLKRKRIFWNFGKSWMRSSRVCASQRTDQGLKYLISLLTKGLNFLLESSAEWISSTFTLIYGDNILPILRDLEKRGDWD